MIILMCICRGGWTLFDLIRSIFCECHGVYTTKKTASSAGATTTAGRCYDCRFHFETEKPKVFCIEEIVVGNCCIIEFIKRLEEKKMRGFGELFSSPEPKAHR